MFLCVEWHKSQSNSCNLFHLYAHVILPLISHRELVELLHGLQNPASSKCFIVYFTTHAQNWNHEPCLQTFPIVNFLPSRLTTLHCTPSKKLITNMQNHLVHHLIGTKLRCAPKCTSVQSYMDIGPPCWCTTQPGGAQCRSMVHNVVLYSQDGAQCRSYKHRQTDMTSSINFDTWCKREKLLEMFHLEMSIVSVVAK